MLFYICKWTIISFILIFLIHHFYQFLINTLTVPKTKDLVNKPNDTYKEMFDSLRDSTSSSSSSLANNGLPTSSSNERTATAAALESTINDSTMMKDELTTFLNDLKKNDNRTHDTRTDNTRKNDILYSNTNEIVNTSAFDNSSFNTSGFSEYSPNL